MSNTGIPGCDGKESTDVAPGSVFAARRWMYNPSKGSWPLAGLFSGVWAAQVNKARCRVTNHHGDRVPVEECGCGFWGYWHPNFAQHGGGNIEGVVECYGKTLIGTRGCRSEQARIVALSVGAPPVTMLRNLPAGCIMPSADYPQSSIDAAKKEIADSLHTFYGVPTFADADIMYQEFPPSSEYLKETPPPKVPSIYTDGTVTIVFNVPSGYTSLTGSVNHTYFARGGAIATPMTITASGGGGGGGGGSPFSITPITLTSSTTNGCGGSGTVYWQE